MLWFQQLVEIFYALFQNPGDDSASWWGVGAAYFVGAFAVVFTAGATIFLLVWGLRLAFRIVYKFCYRAWYCT